MPTYQFYCPGCKRELALTMPYEELETLTCDCGETMKRNYGFGGISFNGSGFYSTDK